MNAAPSPAGTSDADLPDGPDALGDLLQDNDVAAAAAAKLAGMGSGAKSAVPALAAALAEDRPAAVRVAAAEALGTLGQDARGAFVALERASADPDDAVAGAARGALNAIGGGEYA